MGKLHELSRSKNDAEGVRSLVASGASLEEQDKVSFNQQAVCTANVLCS
jgi:hypothetical protein